MSLYLLASDIHLCDKPPSSCTESYTDDLFDLLEQVGEVGRRRKVDAEVWAGDTFHLKSPTRTSHGLVIRTADLIQRRRWRVYLLPGNHDFPYDRLDLVDRQPLGALYRAGARRLEGWADNPDGSLAHPLYGVPWLQGYGDWGAYDGEDAHPPIERNLGAALRAYTDPTGGEWEKPCLVVAHAPLYPPGQENPYEYFPAARWAEAMGGGPGYVFYGHVHEPHGVYQASADLPANADQASHFGHRPLEPVTFCNYGALSRGSLHEYNLTRQVGCTLWDDETGEFEFVPLDARPAEQVFRLAEKQQEAGQRALAEEFLAGIGAASLEAVSVESVIEHIRTLKDMTPEAVALAAELLTEAAHG